MGRKGKQSDLGRALARRRQRDKEASVGAANTTNAQHAAAMGRHTTTLDGPGKLQSVLDATDLEEFMLNAAMANEGFAADRFAGPLAPQTVVVTPLHSDNASQRREAEKRSELDRTALRIPRRPFWDSSTTPSELLAKETQDFLTWRRKIASMEEENRLASTIGGPMMTPFEKNIEVWRQLWRVVERSDVVIQIVDARNPLLYYCQDMYRYVTKEMGRSHLLVLNKADLLSSDMITRWEAYFQSNRMDALFFSAFKASVNEEVHDSRVMGAPELIDKLQRFERRAPVTQPNQRLVVGMCGYPNVGKSSTINVLLDTVTTVDGEKISHYTEGDSSITSAMNEHDSDTNSALEEQQAMSVEAMEPTHALAGAVSKKPKRVAVSATPGRTKHFQTLVLNENVLLCDCPGLVFPNFSSSKAELICAGVLSIDQMRGDHLTTVSLIAERIPAAIFEGVYGLRFRSASEGVFTDTDELLHARKGFVSGTMLLDTHARARGFMSDHDKPDQGRSTRVLLKDYVNGRIIFCHAPPPRDIEDGESGIGPAVHARKGDLVYQRQEAAATAPSDHPGTELHLSSKGSRDVSVNGIEGGRPESGQVKARVSGSKKYEHREFTRVQRSFYPAV